MNPLGFVAPDEPRQVHELLAEHGFDAQLISGGTGLVNFLKQQLVDLARLIGCHEAQRVHAVCPAALMERTMP